MFQIRNKVALVTGSTAGLGKELAFQLGLGGARIALNGRDPAKLQMVTREFKANGFEIAAIKGDVSSPEECREIIDQCIEAFGGLDILISNAGVGSGGLFEDTTPETFRKVFEVNTLGTIYITRFALPHIRQSRGSIVFISSLAGLVGLPYSSLYCGSKMALTALAQSLRTELSGTGVHLGIAYVGFLKNSPEKRVVGPAGELQRTGNRDNIRRQSMEKASRAIIRLIRKRKHEMVMSALGKALSLALRFAPWMIRLILLHSKKKALEAYKPMANP